MYTSLNYNNYIPGPDRRFLKIELTYRMYSVFVQRSSKPTKHQQTKDISIRLGILAGSGVSPETL